MMNWICVPHFKKLKDEQICGSTYQAGPGEVNATISLGRVLLLATSLRGYWYWVCNLAWTMWADHIFLSLAEQNDYAGIAKILQKGVHPDVYSDGAGRTGLWLSIRASVGFYDCAKLLLDYGANVEHKNMNNYCLLCEMVAAHRLDSIRFLLAETDVSITSENGPLAKNPMMMACELGHADIVHCLLARSPTTEILNKQTLDGHTALVLAVLFNRIEVVNVLCEYDKTNLNFALDDGTTPIFHAAKHGHHEILRTLLAYDVSRSINRRALQERLTPLLVAATNGHRNCVEILASDDRVDLFVSGAHGLNALEISTQKRYMHLSPYLHKAFHMKKVSLRMTSEKYYRKRIKSKSELRLIQAFLRAWSKYRSRQQIVQSMHVANRCAHERRQLATAKVLRNVLVKKWRTYVVTVKRIHRIVKQLETSHDRHKFSASVVDETRAISLYKAPLGFVEAQMQKKVFECWHLYATRIASGKEIMRIVSYPFMRAMFRRFNISCNIARTSNHLIFKAIGHWYFETKRLKNRRRKQRVYRHWKLEAKVEAARWKSAVQKLHQNIVRPKFSQWILFHQIYTVYVNAFLVFNEYVRNRKQYRENTVAMKDRERFKRLCRDSFEEWRTHRLYIKRNRAAVKLQSIYRGYQVRITHADSILLWNKTVADRILLAKRRNKARILLYLLAKNESMWCKMAFKYFHKLCDGDLFQQLHPLKTLHIQLRAFGIRTSRQNIIRALEKYKVQIGTTTDFFLDFELFLSWILLCSRDGVFDACLSEKIKNAEKNQHKQKQLVVRETYRGISATMLKKNVRRKRQRVVETAKDVPSILREVVKTLDAQDNAIAEMQKFYLSPRNCLALSASERMSIVNFSRAQSPYDLILINNL
jgi:ankyrin repeat protein